MPSSPPPRRQRSRSLPWVVPAVLLSLCLVGGLLLRFVMNQQASDNTPTSPLAVVATPTFSPDFDPLEDPLISASDLQNAERITILLLGTDGRDEEDGPPRTDMMMVAVLDRNQHRATLISIPRDLWVPIPGYVEGKANTAFFLGALEERGQELAQETVEGVVGFPIDHVVQVDFDGFRTLVDEMGGLVIDVPTAIDDPEFPDSNYGTYNLVIPAGVQTLNGEAALAYARTRYGGTDHDRAMRQQAVLLAARATALEPDNLARAPLLVRTLYQGVESTLTLGDFFELARFGRDLSRDDISMHTINGDLTTPTITWNGQDALIYDTETVQNAIAGWLEE